MFGLKLSILHIVILSAVGTLLKLRSKCGCEHHTIGSCNVHVKPPNVVSVPYAGSESSFTSSDITRKCQEYAKVRYIPLIKKFPPVFRFLQLGMMGITVIYSSGNAGVTGVNCSQRKQYYRLALFSLHL
jgi:hypothetical protein